MSIKYERKRINFLKPRKILKIIQESGGRCTYCNIGINEFNLTIEHKKPLVKGGTSDINNLCISCIACNKRKGQMSEEAYLNNYKIGLSIVRVLNILPIFKSKILHHN